MHPDEEKTALAAEQRHAWLKARDEQARQAQEEAHEYERGQPRRRRDRRFWMLIALGSWLPAALLGALTDAPYLTGAAFLLWLGYCTARIVRAMEGQSPADAVVRGILIFVGLVALNVVIVVGLVVAGCAVFSNGRFYH